MIYSITRETLRQVQGDLSRSVFTARDIAERYRVSVATAGRWLRLLKKHGGLKTSLVRAGARGPESAVYWYPKTPKELK